uniref:DUF7086 domain-containing protein n=1 Tax=Oryza nivara TaxID=4536 RepID=A0A0E0HHS4_ORYNI
MNPVVPNCDNCGHEKCMRPVIATEKERINWLFLLLGETLGLRMLDQLKSRRIDILIQTNKDLTPGE